MSRIYIHQRGEFAFAASEQTISQLKNDIREQKARYAQLATKSALSDRDMQTFIAGKPVAFPKM